MLTEEAVANQRKRREVVKRVMFSVKALYGLSRRSVPMPLNRTESIESGQVCVTIDPEADPSGNIGVIDYTQGEDCGPGRLKVRYAVQAVFPGLYDLITTGQHDPTLLYPVRLVATDDCTLTPDMSGWHALGCLDFLQGSVWAGATGG
jgi:hypothetical protein